MHQYDLHDILVKRKRLTGFRNGEEWGGTFFSISLYSPSASSRHFLFFLNFFFFFTRSDIIVARQDAMDFRPLVFFSLIVFTLSNNPSTFRFLCCRVQRLYLFPGSFLYFVIETIFLFPYVAFSVYHSHPPPPQFSTSGCYFLCTSNRCHCFLYTSFWNVSRILKPDRPLRWKSVGGGGEGVALNVE